jgi:DNA-binding response OmpR family regulator
VDGEEGQRTHLLIVEDEPMIGRILEHKLRREGHAVTWVQSAAAAADILEGSAASIDLALVDVTLECDGIDFMTRLREHERPRRGWLVMHEVGDATARLRALANGARGSVDKPFKPTAVAALVSNLLEGGRHSS